LGLEIGFIDHISTPLVTTLDYSAMANRGTILAFARRDGDSTKISVSIASVPAEVRNEHLRNTNPGASPLDQPVGSILLYLISPVKFGEMYRS
jgi:hypothetical protein